MSRDANFDFNQSVDALGKIFWFWRGTEGGSPQTVHNQPVSPVQTDLLSALPATLCATEASCTFWRSVRYPCSPGPIG